MSIRRNGKLIKCPECKSDNIEVIEAQAFNYETKCKDCGKKFLTGHPIISSKKFPTGHAIIKGQKDFWNQPEYTTI